jgi:hypothetical protein
MAEIFVPYKNKHRLQRMIHLAPKHEVAVGLQDYHQEGFVDLTGDRAAIDRLVHEVDHPVLQVKP